MNDRQTVSLHLKVLTTSTTYLPGHRLAIIEQIVLLDFPILRLEFCRLSRLRIIQYDIDFTHRAEQTTKETLKETVHAIRDLPASAE